VKREEAHFGSTQRALHIVGRIQDLSEVDQVTDSSVGIVSDSSWWWARLGDLSVASGKAG
jgi:hypothetical protein